MKMPIPTRIGIDPSVLEVDRERRQRILPILEAALAAVDPADAVRRAFRVDGNRLSLPTTYFDLDRFRHVYLIGFGKAATPMARAAADALGDRLTCGLLVTKYDHGPGPEELPFQVRMLEAGHPVPDMAGEAAARGIAELAMSATAQDLVICLISGGGSALLTLPAGHEEAEPAIAGLTLGDLQTTTTTLLRCGATINEINTLRKHLSRVKGGQLARLAAPATLISLVVSDVVGSPLDVIASGPTVPDPSTWQDCWSIVETYGLQQELPKAAIDRLRAGLDGRLADTPKAGNPVFERSQTLIIADNALAAAAAQTRAEKAGFQSRVLSTFVEGEARDVAKVLVALGREVVAYGRPTAWPACLILGGETTVTVRGQGKGGRNQELALAAAVVLDQVPEGGHIVIASLASDGTDGPTDAAGGLVDSTTLARGRALGLDAAAALAENDAYPFLQAVGDLLVTGPTQTNVNDLMFIFVF